MIEVLYDPDGFFDGFGENPSLAAPALVVLLVGLLGAARGWVMLQTIDDALPEGTGAILAIAQSGGAIASLFTVFIFWFLYALLFYGLSTAFDGQGSFGRTMKMVGWGYMPVIFSSAVTVYAMHTATQAVPAPESQAALQPYLAQIQDQPIFFVSGLLTLSFALWQGFIWTFAMKHARNLDLREAAMTVAVPVGLTLIWRASGLL